MDELGGDLIKSGVGNVMGEFASHSSGGAGNFFDALNSGYEQYGNAEDAVSRVKLIIHLAHRSKGIDYDSDCKECNP